VAVFGLAITGGLGTPVVAAERGELVTGAGIAELGWIDAANSAMSTVAILVRFTLAAISIAR
jgi:hypothetical protein